MPELSVVIPAYNEEKRLPPVLHSVHAFFAARGLDFEIIIVNDGSTDNTDSLVNQFSARHREIKLIEHPVNKGKGFALKTGVLAACGDLILINDADGSSPIAEFDRLSNAIVYGADLAIGSRAKADLSCAVEALPYRTHMGNVFNRIVQFLLLPGIYDTQCGFKLFKKKVAHDLFSLLTIDGYAWDVELLYLARLRQYKMEEIAINWHSVSGSKVNVFVDSFKMLLEVLRIKSRYAEEKYLINWTRGANDYISSRK